MKFSEYLWNNLTPEWYSQYINYDRMKELLDRWTLDCRSTFDDKQTEERRAFYVDVDQRFFEV